MGTFCAVDLLGLAVARAVLSVELVDAGAYQCENQLNHLILSLRTATREVGNKARRRELHLMEMMMERELSLPKVRALTLASSSD